MFLIFVNILRVLNFFMYIYNFLLFWQNLVIYWSKLNWSSLSKWSKNVALPSYFSKSRWKWFFSNTLLSLCFFPILLFSLIVLKYCSNMMNLCCQVCFASSCHKEVLMCIIKGIELEQRFSVNKIKYFCFSSHKTTVPV